MATDAFFEIKTYSLPVGKITIMLPSVQLTCMLVKLLEPIIRSLSKSIHNLQKVWVRP